MSSILDALERAEKERNQLDKKTFLDTVTAGPGLLQRRGLWVFVGILLLINLLVWLWVGMNPDQTSEQQANVRDQSAPRQQPMATADTVVSILEQPQVGKERKSDPPLLVEALVSEKEVMSKSTESVNPADVPATGVSSQATARPQPLVEVGKTETAGEPREPASIPSEVMEEPVQTASPDESRLAKVTDAQLAVDELDRTVQQESEQDGTEQIPLLWELPAKVQEKLSDLKINILVYDEDAARRFVIINMRKYREGERLVPSGMQLERITRKGIVVNYGDGLVRL
ncbi:MAG: general secretion pathway protein GspB [Chromatiales bacterium]|jgi:hypothetical protein